KPISKVLVAYDGGASAMKAVDHVARSPLFQGLAVHVVTVGSATPEVTKGLEDARAMLKAAGIEAETSVLPGQPETTLAKLVEEAQFDMLVMGAYGHSRIRSLIIGSVTTAMIRACRVPIVLVRQAVSDPASARSRRRCDASNRTRSAGAAVVAHSPAKGVSILTRPSCGVHRLRKLSRVGVPDQQDHGNRTDSLITRLPG
ncbi:MAG: universal stress protein, partial [Hyphomicrobiaceae bacterium]